MPRTHVIVFLLAIVGISATNAAAPAPETIAVLNASSCVNKAHLEALGALGKLTVYDDTDTAAEARDRLRGVRIAIAQPFNAPLDQSVLDATDSLQLLVLCTTGYDLVDLNAEIARGFDTKVLVWDRSEKDVAAAGATQVSIEELLRQSDVVSLHIALKKDTEKFLSAPRLALMKPTAVLLNTARGKLVDESALHEMTTIASP